MDAQREDLPNDVAELADRLLERLRLQSASGRVELEFRDRRLTKLRRHEEFSRSELSFAHTHKED